MNKLKWMMVCASLAIFSSSVVSAGDDDYREEMFMPAGAGIIALSDMAELKKGHSAAKCWCVGNRIYKLVYILEGVYEHDEHFGVTRNDPSKVYRATIQVSDSGTGENVYKVLHEETLSGLDHYPMTKLSDLK